VYLHFDEHVRVGVIVCLFSFLRFSFDVWPSIAFHFDLIVPCVADRVGEITKVMA